LPFDTVAGLFQLGPDPMLLVTAGTGMVVEANERCTSLLGHARHEMIGRTALELGLWADLGDRGRFLGLLEREHHVEGFETQIVDRDGRQIWSEISTTVFEGPGGACLMVVARDISGRKAAEEALRTSEARLRWAMEAASDGLWDWDIPTGQVHYSPAYTRMLGYGPGEWEARMESWADTIHPDDRARVIDANQACIDGSVTAFEVEYRMRTRSGDWKWILGRGRAVLRDPHGKALRVVGTHVDMTDRRRAEESVRESELKFSKVFNSAPILGSLSLVADGTLIAVNDMYCQTLGLTRDGVIGRTSIELGVFGARDRERLIAALQPAGHCHNVETTLHARDGRLVPCLVSAEAVEVGGQELLIAMIADITERKRSEEQRSALQAEVEHLQKLDSLGRLAGGVAHDMNNVLGAIYAVTQTVRFRHQGDRDLDDALATVERAANRGRDLVKGLMGLTRKDLAAPVAIDLNELVRQEMTLLERTLLQRYRLVMDLEQPLPPIQGETGTLGSALMNLCVNAVDAMPDGGTLTIRTRRLAGAKVQIAVEDTGEGMTPQVLKQAMDPFFTTKPFGRGTGLGLSTVFNTARSHGGAFALHSEPGRGTRAVLTLPAGASRPAPAPPEAPPPVKGSWRILVVDDDELLRAAIPAMLQVLGHRAEALEGGRAALARVDRDGSPDLVILDINMPGMNGLETLRHLRERDPRLPVLLATGFLDREVEAAVQTDPCTLAMTKPFSMEDMRRKFAEVAVMMAARAPA
jgi:PAS domain S-box-containing protein